MSRSKHDQRGFSLVELSIVFLIIGLLVGTAAVPLSSAIEQSRYKRTVAQLTTIREALHGYLISTGRLPCPLKPDSAVTVEKPTDTCSRQHGVLPATSLGLIGERSDGGALLDVWGRPYLYSVSMADHAELGEPKSPDWLSVGEPAAVGAKNLSAELQLCRKAAAKNCPEKDLIANQVVWVVQSKGESDGGRGAEAENADDDHVFSVSGYSSNQEQPFDDQIIWASRSELVYWLLKSGWLP